MDIRDYQDISMEVAFPEIPEDDRLPVVDWYNEDKTQFPKASDTLNPKTNTPYIDESDNFLVSPQGNFLMNEDFVFVNTHKLREAAEKFESDKRYTDAATGTYEYNTFKEQEEDRRYRGFTAKCKLYKKDVEKYNSLPKDKRWKVVHDIHITGEQYNFINFGQLKVTDESSIEFGKMSAVKKMGIARFFYSQYWWTQAKQFAIDNGYNHVVVKSRRAGWSFLEAIDTANIANLIPHSTQLLTAYDKKYLVNKGGIADMARMQLDFYEKHTPFNRCGWTKNGPAGLLSKNIEELVLGYKDKAGTNQGWLSTVASYSFGPANPDVAIGKDAIKIKVEEMSNAPNFAEFMDVTIPTTTAGAFKTGLIIGFGTGGSTEGDWRAFKDWYYNPSQYDAMPFANVWDPNAFMGSVGYFKPYVMNLEGFDSRGVMGMDVYGNPNYVAATAIYKEERRLKKANPKTTNHRYLVYCGQLANMPSESFAVSKDNMFSSYELMEHKKRVEIDDALKFYRDGWMSRDEKGKAIFTTNTVLRSKKQTIHSYLEHARFKTSDDVYGCVREFYPPIKDEFGKIPDGLYRIYYDGVAIDKDIKEMRSDNSLDSVVVKMVNNNIVPGGGEIIVARYHGRTGTLDTTNRMILDLCDYYNAKVLPEVDRGNIVQTFKRWRRRDRLVATPIHVFDIKQKDGMDVSYGINIGGGPKKADGLRYLKEWLYTKRGVDENGNQLYNFHFIYDIPILEELLTWNPDDNFDGVSTLIVMAYDVQELIMKNHKVKKKKKKGNSVFNHAWF